jgi:hypothetical protein
VGVGGRTSRDGVRLCPMKAELSVCLSVLCLPAPAVSARHLPVTPGTVTVLQELKHYHAARGVTELKFKLSV